MCRFDFEIIIQTIACTSPRLIMNFSEVIYKCICRFLVARAAESPSRSSLVLGLFTLGRTFSTFITNLPLCTHHHDRHEPASLLQTTRARTRNRSAPHQKRPLDICAYCAPAPHHLATQNRRDKLLVRVYTIETATAHWTEGKSKQCPWSLRDRLLQLLG